ncbi:MAG: ATPase, T2SS/T4P/T4SS family [Patescibacteria group bacterium]
MNKLVNKPIDQLTRQITLSLAPIKSLLEDEAVTDIIILGYQNVIAKRIGEQLQKVDAKWESESDLITACSQVGRNMKRPISQDQPLLDARLPDGSRINIVFPPCHNADGPCVTIRKFPKDRLTADKILEKGSIDKTGLEILQAAIAGGKNILVSGGTGSGKTTLLNILASFISRTDRVISIEDSRELGLNHPLWSALETKQKLYEEDQEVDLPRLVVNALRMFPRWLILGEVRGPEAWDLMRAFNTGHSGLATIHANDVRGALMALENLSMTAVDMRVEPLREYISRAISMVVQIVRFPDDTRRVVDISEIAGLDQSSAVPTYRLNRLHYFAVQGYDNGRVLGDFRVDTKPSFRQELRNYNIAVPAWWEETKAGYRQKLEKGGQCSGL